ncbi:MAG TPA: hypothetical protein VMH89_13110, partial [Candidatus Acidoferrum sp.]|nr:hypothetical protein [Candidatus Acidoferrum sp.]
ATGFFELPPEIGMPGQVDLGLWNVFANPDYPAPQAGLNQILPKLIGSTSPPVALPRTIALFKTPSLRDLGHSDPYFHTGRMKSIGDAIKFYQNFSSKARIGKVRNAAPELAEVSLDDAALAPLAAFLRSLNEDYTD